MGIDGGIEYMREIDVIRVVVNNMIEGIMFHNQMIQYFEYLGLKGFSDLQKIRFEGENKDLVELQRYVIDTYGVVVGETNPDSRSYIPAEWGEELRERIDVDNRKDYVRFGIETWKYWEDKSKKVYGNAYFNLNDLRDAGGSERILKVVEGTEKELHFVYDLMCKLKGSEYDSVVVSLMDKDVVKMYEKFWKKER